MKALLCLLLPWHRLRVIHIGPLHVHAVCNRCGAMHEISKRRFFDSEIERWSR